MGSTVYFSLSLSHRYTHTHTHTLIRDAYIYDKMKNRKMETDTTDNLTQKIVKYFHVHMQVCVSLK